MVGTRGLDRLFDAFETTRVSTNVYWCLPRSVHLSVHLVNALTRSADSAVAEVSTKPGQLQNSIRSGAQSRDKRAELCHAGVFACHPDRIRRVVKRCGSIVAPILNARRSETFSNEDRRRQLI